MQKKHTQKTLDFCQVKTQSITKDQLKSIKGGTTNSSIVTEDLIDV